MLTHQVTEPKGEVSMPATRRFTHDEYAANKLGGLVRDVVVEELLSGHQARLRTHTYNLLGHGREYQLGGEVMYNQIRAANIKTPRSEAILAAPCDRARVAAAMSQEEFMERAVPVLPADDIEASRRFYVEGLGFEQTWGFTSDDGKSGMFGVARGGMAITVDCPMTGHGRNACVSLEVDDADKYYEEWRQRVKVNGKPKDEEWDRRTFGVTDPAGNTIFVIGPVRRG